MSPSGGRPAPDRAAGTGPDASRLPEAESELRRLNERLSLIVFQLRNVLEVSRELSASLDEEEVRNLLTATLMGQLMVSRCAFYLEDGQGFSCVHERGARALAGSRLPAGEGTAVPPMGAGPVPVASLPSGPLRDELVRARMALLVPLGIGDRAGFLAVGERASGQAFSDEDREFVETLSRQAEAALTSVHLHRVELAKQRQDRELQIAREIQQSLFPRTFPDLPGFELAAASVACQEVGGDHYDFIPLPDGRLALAVADVSGKGTPASILMASVHASLRALAGTAPPAALLARLNRFLFESTQAHKYVTLFYGELDPVSRRLVYVNAGHVPPCHLRGDGQASRLFAGGPALGLLEEASYEEGAAVLEQGDLVAVVTDGVTEALSPDEREFGEEGLVQVLRNGRTQGAEAVLQELLRAVGEWTGVMGCTDDLTAAVVAAR